MLFGGAAGPGKTDCLVAGMTRDIDNPRYHGLILRRTFPQLQEIMDRCHRLYPSMGGTFRSGEKRWYFSSGAVIDLGHMQHEDDKYNYQGKQYHKIAFDELTQFTETQYTYLFSRCRTVDPEIKTQILATTNPGGIGHYWVKERFVSMGEPLRTYYDPTTGLSRVFVPATIEDNPTLFENDPTYLNRLSALSDIEIKRLRYGIWDAFEGQVFTELSERVHGIDDFDVPPEWQRYCVLDWGFAKPFCIHWYAVDYDGVLYLYREWYGCQKEENGTREGADMGLRMVASDVAKKMVEIEQNGGEKIRMRLADPSIFDRRPEKRQKEARGATIAEDFSAEGLYFREANNQREQGKQQVHRRLKLQEEIDTETGEIWEIPQVRIFRSCKGFWRTMPDIREDEKNTEDVDTKQEDHVYDCFRYMCMEVPIIPKKVIQMPQGTFRAERQKLINARKRAKRLGISVAEAYQRRH